MSNDKYIYIHIFVDYDGMYTYICIISLMYVYIHILICKKHWCIMYKFVPPQTLPPPSRFPVFAWTSLAMGKLPCEGRMTIPMMWACIATFAQSWEAHLWFGTLIPWTNGEFVKEVHPPKFNSENPWKPWWLEYYFPIGKVTFQARTVKLWEGILVKCQEVSLLFWVLFCWLKFYILLKGFPEKLYWMHDVGI